jgi:hypothetical protein
MCALSPKIFTPSENVGIMAEDRYMVLDLNFENLQMNGEHSMYHIG